MGDIRWYRRDPRAALAGMMELSLEERGAYNTILDLIYCHNGALDDDPRFIAGWLRCDIRVWKRIRVRLLMSGKLYLNGSKLRNEKADREVDQALNRVMIASRAGITSVEKRKLALQQEVQHRPLSREEVWLSQAAKLSTQLNEINILISTGVSTAAPTTQNQKERVTRGESEQAEPLQVAFDGSKGNGLASPPDTELAAIVRKKGWA